MYLIDFYDEINEVIAESNMEVLPPYSVGQVIELGAIVNGKVGKRKRYVIKNIQHSLKVVVRDGVERHIAGMDVTVELCDEKNCGKKT